MFVNPITRLSTLTEGMDTFFELCVNLFQRMIRGPAHTVVFAALRLGTNT